jgi:hypothetical protein
MENDYNYELSTRFFENDKIKIDNNNYYTQEHTNNNEDNINDLLDNQSIY